MKEVKNKQKEWWLIGQIEDVLKNDYLSDDIKLLYIENLLRKYKMDGD